MAIYRPLATKVDVKASDCRLTITRWRDGAFYIDYVYNIENSYLRASFPRAQITRIIDTLPIGEDEERIGLVRDYLAYSVEGSIFMRLHQDSIAGVEEKLVHYRFISPDSCVDVISSTPPLFRAISIVV